jgi:hypothetical protein
VTAVVMVLAAGKAKMDAALGNPVRATEGADPVAGYVLVLYALREVKDIFFGEH